MSQAICVSCGQKSHAPPCQSSPHCVNCNGPHGSNSRDCPKFQKIRPQIRCHSRRLGRRYQAQYPVDFSRSSVSVLKSSNSISSASQTTRPTRRNVHCQVSLVKIAGDRDKSPELLKAITPTVKPKAGTRRVVKDSKKSPSGMCGIKLEK